VSTAPAIMLAVGGITFGNEWLQSSTASNPAGSPNWKIVPATAVGMIALGLLEKFSPMLGIGLAVIALITELTVSFGGRKSPLAELLSVLGAPNTSGLQ
jgi:hypothetical protein